MIRSMSNPRGLDDFPRDLTHELPPNLRAAVGRLGRSTAAVRVYRRRGWNASAALARRDRDRAEVQRLIDELEHQENNPPLF